MERRERSVQAEGRLVIRAPNRSGNRVGLEAVEVAQQDDSKVRILKAQGRASKRDRVHCPGEQPRCGCVGEPRCGLGVARFVEVARPNAERNVAALSSSVVDDRARGDTEQESRQLVQRARALTHGLEPALERTSSDGLGGITIIEPASDEAVDHVKRFVENAAEDARVDGGAGFLDCHAGGTYERTFNRAIAHPYWASLPPSLDAGLDPTSP